MFGIQHCLPLSAGSAHQAMHPDRAGAGCQTAVVCLRSAAIEDAPWTSLKKAMVAQHHVVPSETADSTVVSYNVHAVFVC